MTEEKRGPLDAARDLADQITSREGLGDRLRLQAQRLREPIIPLPFPDSLREPLATERSTESVRAEIERLAQITAASGEQVAALVALVRDSERAAQRAARITIGLTVVLVILTLAIVWLTWVLVAGEIR